MTTIKSSRDVRKDDKIIAIMGPTGSGKSNFIDKLTTKTNWSGGALQSVTVRAIRIKSEVPGSIEEIVLVDNPGFDDIYMTDLEILEMIAAWLTDTYQREVELVGILYFHRINDRRITGTVNRNMRMLGKLSGVDPAKKLIFVTTMWDKTVADRANANEQELRNDFFKPMLVAGANMERFKNTTDSAWKIVSQLLLRHEDHAVMLIQKEMVDIGKELPETEAAQEVMTELQKLLSVHKKTIEELKRAAEKAEYPWMRAQLNTELAENQKRMAKTYEEVAKLKRSSFNMVKRFFGAKLNLLKTVKLGTSTAKIEHVLPPSAGIEQHSIQLQTDPTARADMMGLLGAWGSSNTKLGDMSRVDKPRTKSMTPVDRTATRTNEPSATNPTTPKNLAQDKKEIEAKPQQSDESGLAAEEPPSFNTTERKSESSNSCEVEPNHELSSLDAAVPLATCSPLAPSASISREVVTQEALGPSLLAKSMTTNPTEGLFTEGQTSPTGYVLPFNYAVSNSGGSTVLEFKSSPTWADTTTNSHSTEEIRGPRSTLASDTCGSLDTSKRKTSSADQITGITESKEIPTFITTADSSYSTKPTSDAISANMFSNAQNMTILGGSYNLNIYPHRDGSDTDVSSDINEFPTLIVSEERLGFGSCGTVVYKGSFQGRPVAVKKLFRDFATLAEREVAILQEADTHPNVIRYHYQETRGNSLFIAIELCLASLADVIAKPHQDEWKDIVINLDPKKALEEITSGLDHLHYLNIIHRDIKPQNILIAGPLRMARNGKSCYRMLISDFGICKKLDDGQTSFMPTTYGASAGTRGWLAPEFLRITLEKGNAELTMVGIAGHGKLTKSLDLFPLGCLFYYTLTKGGHPYGRDFERDVNILKGRKKINGVDKLGEDGRKAKDLITKLLNPEPSGRPDTSACLEHPYFTNP